MRRIVLFLIFYVLLCATASAQPVCPQTPSASASNTNCANTAFVHSVAATVTPQAGFGITVSGSPPTISVDPSVVQYTDIRQWGATPPVCNPASPTSTNVDAAIIAAYNAGHTAFYVPRGCFVYTGDSAWATAFGSNNIPTGTFWQGGDWQTSGFSVCSTYTGCTPGLSVHMTVGSQVIIQNMFYQAGDCYNVDGGTYGNPSYCPVALFSSGTMNGGYMTNFPFQALNLYMSEQSLGTWNGTDSPTIGVTNNSQGDGIFISMGNAAGSGDAYAKNVNLFTQGLSSGTSGLQGPKYINGASGIGEDFQVFWDGSMALGNSSTSHASGILKVTDATASCFLFTGVSSPTWSCSSDGRLKKNIEDSDDQLAWLNSFDIRQFDIRTDGSHVAAGVVAQEVKNNHPEMVKIAKSGPCDSKHFDGCESVDDPSPWRMMKAMQEMQSEIRILQIFALFLSAMLISAGLVTSLRKYAH